MGLWYECGNGPIKLEKSFAKSDIGADVYICCPGPSLANVNDAEIHVPGAVIFGINTAYPKIRPDIWVGVDTPECYDYSLWWEPFMKICRGGYKNIECCGQKISRCSNVYFADLEVPQDGLNDIFSKRAHDTKFIWKKNTLALTLHIAIWMGARNINFVGCDFGGDKDYYDDRELTKERRDSNQRLYRQQVEMLKEFSVLASRRNIQLTSCTPNSPINDFIPYKPLEDMLKLSKQRVPKKNNRIAHAADVHDCQWSSEPKHKKGVMVGCTKIHEDLIPWWIDNYKKHNDYPIAFADFGMSDEYKDVCRENGVLIDCTGIKVEGWFRKPFAILKAPFENIIWCDTDIEIRRNLDSVFEYSNDGEIGAGWDSHAPEAFKHHIYEPNVKLWDSGFLSVMHGNYLVTEWALKILNAPRGHYYGDHEVLSIVLWENDMPLNEIPKSIHRMRIDPAANGINDSELISMHWTGQQGKDQVRRQISNREQK